MVTDRKDEAMKLALEALELSNANHWWGSSSIEKAIGAIREALAEQPAQQQEPVSLEDSLKESKVCCGDYANCHRACTPRGRWEALRLVETAQPSKPWVGLTEEERGQVYASWRFNGSNSSNLELCRAIEAKLKDKNG